MMKKHEAIEIANNILIELRQRSYDDLRILLTQKEKQEGRLADGSPYIAVAQANWDNRVNGNLRVSVLVDDGGLRAMKPFSNDFIISPEGDFIGED